ncbi:excinuclease ABC subunit UvrC [archaeon]|nr:excinuclease ABC subunit UvrC [archaeon]
MKYNPPKNPGVYLMKDKDESIIYVGKAKNIKKRVTSYFHSKNHTPKTQELVHNIEDIDFIITDNEVEALILESEQIRKHKPKFNMMLKDSLRYAYIKITDEKYPRIITARKKTKKGKFYGPYVSGFKRKNLVEISKRIFKIRACKTMPKSVCLLYHIKRCSGPCEDHISKQDYNKQIDNFKEVLKGRTNELITKLESEMELYSKHQQYEKAKEIRDQINDLDFTEKQKIELNKNFDQDVIVKVEDKNIALITLFNIKRGVISGKKEYKFPLEEELLSSFIRSYYLSKSIPKEIIIDENLDDKDALEKFLSMNKNSSVVLTNPIKGNKRQILDMVIKNAEFTLKRDVLEELRINLKLLKKPEIIECFDISTLGGTENVGACVQFKDGVPNKSEYMLFKIRDVDYQDDFASMAESVRRRYSRQLKENKPLPDLIVIDGGKGQLGLAKKELENLQLNIPIIGLAKEFEEVHTIGRQFPIIIDKKSESLKLLQKIRDETHRFVINFQRKRRKKIFIETGLDKIEGIGEKTKFKLLQKFGSLENIKNSSINELKKIVGEKLAKKIKSNMK